ncbi:LytR/AlgR family response regulator transcription factor [Sphingobacterium sp. LRF_L2]|uniref:LytR/AlgR family response regulator transcription factor n=1 Tax=Sphingobacterium sp. LRF_L2 TaxID=3369421 RepID=UPI003F63EB62
MKIKCILIDDEPFALNLLEDDLLSFSHIEVLAKFYSPIDAAEYLLKNEVDVLFLDIQMPEMLGTQFIRQLENPPLVIFTTAYHQYAVEGFELNAIDYLLKPIGKERLTLSLRKVEDLIRLRKNQIPQQDKTFIVINVEYQKTKIFFNEINYIEGLKDYVKIYLKNRAHPLLTRSNLRGMEAKLPSSQFIRIHNSFIVNKLSIKKITQTKLLLPDVELPIGKKYADNITSFDWANAIKK